MIFKRTDHVSELIRMLGGDSESHINSGFWLLDASKMEGKRSGCRDTCSSAQHLTTRCWGL